MSENIIDEISEKRIVEAIEKAEQNTSGEIRVHVQKKIIGDVLYEAKTKFEELGMADTELRNGVLIFIAVNDRQFSIIGDHGINEVVSDDFWEKTVDIMKEHFVKGDLVEGIEAGVLHAGEALKKYFPYKSDDQNELPNELSQG